MEENEKKTSEGKHEIENGARRKENRYEKIKTQNLGESKREAPADRIPLSEESRDKIYGKVWHKAWLIYGARGNSC